ncbi:MAG: DUF3137 domain-containing protein [Candidatus Izemoplasmatales bacterium]
MFDKINNEKAYYEKRMILGFVVTFLAFVLYIPIAMTLGPIGFFITAVPFLGGALYAGRNSKKIKEISNGFKQKYVAEELVKVFPNSVYKPHDGFKEKEVAYSNLLHEQDRYYSEDMILGDFDGVNFRCSDVKQQDVRSSGKSTTVVTVFQGRFYEFDFHKPFKYDLLVVQPMNFRPFSGFIKVKTESIDFNTELKIYARDEQEAFYILTPDFMEKLRYLDNKYSNKIIFSFKDNKLFIAIDNRKDYFDIRPFKPVDQSLISSFKEEFEDVKNFIVLLNLNSTLFK